MFGWSQFSRTQLEHWLTSLLICVPILLPLRNLIVQNNWQQLCGCVTNHTIRWLVLFLLFFSCCERTKNEEKTFTLNLGHWSVRVQTSWGPLLHVRKWTYSVTRCFSGVSGGESYSGGGPPSCWDLSPTGGVHWCPSSSPNPCRRSQSQHQSR